MQNYSQSGPLFGLNFQYDLEIAFDLEGRIFSP